MQMRLSQPFLGDEEISAVRRVIESEFLGMGVEVAEFEENLAQFFGNPAVCVNTGTAALQLALTANGIEAGDEVLVPSLTYIATYQAISGIGAVPVSCDVQVDDLQLDLEDASRKITSKTKAIVPVYYSGATNCADRVWRFSKANNLINIPDAAHAFGSSSKGSLIGSGAGTHVFSLDGIKNVTSGEGGVIISSNPEVIRKAKDARLLGVIGDSEKRSARERSWDFDVEAQGWRYHMSDLFAAIGKVQLDRFDEMAEIRKSLYIYYQKLLKNDDRVSLFGWDIHDGMVPHVFVIRIPGLTNRQQLRERMLSDGIPTGVHYKPNHLLSFYAHIGESLPVTESIYPEILTLPFHLRLTPDDLERVTSSLRENLKHVS